MSRIAIVIIPGYKQGVLPGTGPAIIYDQLYKAYDSRSDAVLLFRSWKSPAMETARLLNSQRPDRLAVVGYSYGCGWGIPELAKAIAPFSLPLDLAILIDPVPRYRGIFKPLSLTRLNKYRVPRYIDKVHTFRQCNASPYGRQLVAYAGTRIGIQQVYGSVENLKLHGGPGHHTVDNDMDHSAIDNDPRIRNAVIKIIEEWANVQRLGCEY